MSPHILTATATTFLLLLLHLLPPASSQQIGSFFTAIQYNNGAIPGGYSACSGMGGNSGSYCCNGGQSCAWDDAGHVACCALGSSCSGSPYQGDYAGAKYSQSSWGAAGEGCNTCQAVCNTCQEQTTTVYQQQTWQPTTSYAAVAPVTTSWQPTTTLVTSSVPGTVTETPTTVVGAAAGGVRVTTTVPPGQACGNGGYTTLVKANVGQPTRTVGCYVIIDAGSRSKVGRWVWVVTGIMMLRVGVGWWS